MRTPDRTIRFRSSRDRDPLRDEGDDVEDALRAELVSAGVIDEW